VVQNFVPINGEPFTDTFGSTIDQFAPKPLEVSFSKDGYEDRDIFGASLNIDYDMNNGYAFKSISAYRDSSIQYVNDTDVAAFDFLHIDYTDAYEQTTGWLHRLGYLHQLRANVVNRLCPG